MNPGATTQPAASIERSPDSPVPMPTILPSDTATSPDTLGAPVPSTIVPPRSTVTSAMVAILSKPRSAIIVAPAPTGPIGARSEAPAGAHATGTTGVRRPFHVP